MAAADILSDIESAITAIMTTGGGATELTLDGKTARYNLESLLALQERYKKLAATDTAANKAPIKFHGVRFK